MSAKDFEASEMLQKTMENAESGGAEDKKENDLVYSIEDVPPWYMSLILGLQHYLTMFSGAVAMPFIITPYMCMGDDSPYRGHIICATLFASGLASFIQATFGCRLPIIQGPSLAFLVPTLAILSLPQWKCPSPEIMKNMTEVEAGEVWMSRMREVQGAIIVGAIVEVLVGITGLTGFLMKWITPLSIAPTITLIGLSLFKEAARQASGNWWISSLTMLLLIVFSQYLTNVTVPGCSYSKEKKWQINRFAFFKMFPVILTIFLSWGLCAILTAADVFSANDPGRTDLRLSAFGKTRWFRIPYPGQWGVPTFNIGPALGVVAGVIASTVESVGDYYACAKLAGAPAPPVHAVNRGITVEGLGCLVAGVIGTCSGLTSFSQNVGAIAITKVGSRRVVQYASVILVIFGMIAKFGVLFIAIPAPVMGGIFFIMFAIITGVGLSNLQYVNLNSSRNLFIIGFSIFMGLSIPTYLDGHPTGIQTGYTLIDQILSILLKTHMFIGGFLGCLLDNTIPASKAERGLSKWRKESMTDETDKESGDEKTCYDMPFGMKFIRNFRCLRYFPISPTYKNENISFNLCKRKRNNSIKPSDGTEMTLPGTYTS